MISLPDDPKPGVPRIHVPDEGPTISISEEDEHDHLPAPPQITVTTSPSINITSFTGPDASSSSLASSGSSAGASARHRAGLFCAGCGGGITGRIVSAMEKRWHPACFKCEKCGELLEHVSSFEHEGKAYCHLDYHEHFAPRCFHCETPIADSQFITLDDPSLPGGPRTYHELHFFCAECGDPFLDPSKATGAPRTGGGPKGDEEDEVGFTIWKGHPYCELCHVRLHLPKCKGCKKPIREVEPAVEVKRGKWHWSCFVCETCKKPFADGTFFERQDKAFCDGCYRILLRNEI
ncbi:LIM-domain-containing protein [Calocera viscosa TUFC12733]|uniref:LIM-domain-containing protein n=1 Tax=Calocera viscosa (strain TUFC12733) TaxID=1330018 RepID=A0A167K236_CALVF|nr:LIM-domain-containing protein [Calocera viscosa TUFC12733]